MASERDIGKLLALILESCRHVTGADAGSVYVVEDDPAAPDQKRLRFMLSQNDSIPINFREFTLPVDESSIVGKAVLSGQPINIPDLAALREAGRTPTLSHNRSFDDKTGYRARSMLTRADDVGDGRGDRRRPADQQEARIARGRSAPARPFPSTRRPRSWPWPGWRRPGVSLEKALLYDEIRQMFDGFVDASVQAIEQRDPTTAGIRGAWRRCRSSWPSGWTPSADGPLADVRFDDARLQQIEYAAVLHDFGKVGVRERVLVKPRKLYDEDRRAIQMRFAYIKKALQVAHAERKLRVALEPARKDVPRRLAEIDAELARQLDAVDEVWAFVNRANEPTLLDQGGFERLVEIARMTYLGIDGEPRPYLEPDESPRCRSGAAA